MQYLRIVPLTALFALPACASGPTEQVETALAASTRVADALGVVVLYLCDQAELRAIDESDSQAQYDSQIAGIREVCDPVADAYGALGEAQLATLSAVHLVDNCQAKGAACVAEVGNLAEAAAHALAAGDVARRAAEGAVEALRGEHGSAPEATP